MHSHASFVAHIFKPTVLMQFHAVGHSDGYGVYQQWVNRRQTCLAHLIRTARGLSEKQDPELAACGAWALSELQRLGHMAKAPPSGGEWKAWYARFWGSSQSRHLSGLTSLHIFRPSQGQPGLANLIITIE